MFSVTGITATRSEHSALLAGMGSLAANRAVEATFLVVAPWIFSRAYLPVDPAFAFADFALSLLLGGVTAAVLAAVLKSWHVDRAPREIGTIALLLLCAINLIGHRAAAPIVLVGIAIVILLTACIAAIVRERFRDHLRIVTNPWTASLLLLAPIQIATDLTHDISRLSRVLLFGGASIAILVVSALFVRTLRGRPGKPWLSIAVGATIVALSTLASPPAPREHAIRRAEAPLKAPNILLVTLDTVRADHLSLYGYSRETTPAVQQFAAKATVYTRAMAPSNMTLASHASIFTGLYPIQHHAHYDARHPFGRPLGTEMPTLAEIFTRRGYDTSSIVSNYGYLGEGFGLDRGFSYIDARPGRSPGLKKDYALGNLTHSILCRFFPDRWPLNDGGARTADEITRLAIDRIDHARRAKRPYFLFVNYLDAHERVLIPKPFIERFPGASRTEGTVFQTNYNVMARNGSTALRPDDRAVIVAKYDAAIAYMDASLAQLLRRARATDDETMIVITSDHGEAFGDHGLISHGSSVYQEQVWVPLMIQMPHQQTPSLVRSPFSLVDLFSFLIGAMSNLPQSADVVSEAFPLLSEHEGQFRRGGRAIVTADYKLIRSSRNQKIELYDSRSDPAEEHDLAQSSSHVIVKTALNRALDRWILAHPTNAPRDVGLDSDAVSNLRALGYLH